MDLTTITLTGLAIIGAVNVATMFKADLDSRVKFGIAVATALAIGFIPEAIGNEILARITTAIGAALASSGGYKLTQKLGGQ